MSLHITVWAVSVTSPTMEEMGVLLGFGGAHVKGCGSMPGWKGRVQAETE